MVNLFPNLRLLPYAVYFFILVLVSPPPLSAQSVIGGDTIDPSAILDLQSLDKGLLLPRLSSAQRDAMPNPARGLLVFNTSENCIQVNTGQPAAPLWTCLTALPQQGNQKGNLLYWDGAAWVRLGPGLPGQTLALSQQGDPVWSGAAFATLVSTAAASLTASSAQLGGTITADGGSGVVARGIVYGTAPLPTLSNATLLLGDGTGSFSGTVSGLQPGTAYFFRAFASNGAGTAYGNLLSFTTYPLAQVGALDCANALHTGTMVSGVAVSGAGSSISYQGGNGGYFGDLAIASSGVTGLTATLSAGVLANGAGTLVFSISGTPSGSGTANFPLNLGGQSCVLVRTVAPATVTAVQCSSAVLTGQLVAGKAANGSSVSLPYSGGNGGAYGAQTIASTGVTGLTAQLAAGQLSIGPGSLNYTLTGTASGSGTAQFALQIGGQSCTLSLSVVAGGVASLDCANAVHNGQLTIGSVASSVHSILSYTGGNGGSYSGQTVASTGVTGLTATLASGLFAEGTGTLTYSITGTPSAAGTASFVLQLGGQTCTLSRSVLNVGFIDNLICSGANHKGLLKSRIPASGDVNTAVPYSGGNGGNYAGITANSSGVLGLTASLASGTFVNGSDSLRFLISGTPSSAGTAIFTVSIGGRSCSFSREVGSSCGANIAPGVFREFMCHNLGVVNTNADPFVPSWEINGAYWQWGKKDIANLAPIGPSLNEANSGPVTGWVGYPYAPNGAWLDESKTSNDPCPSGFRVPTKNDWDNVVANNNIVVVGTWGNSVTNYSCGKSFGSGLFLPTAGYGGAGGIADRGNLGFYWSSTPAANTNDAWYLYFYGDNRSGVWNGSHRGNGFSVRCIAE